MGSSGKGHCWSGWPGAYCLRCGSEDPLEKARDVGWWDFDNMGNMVWVSGHCQRLSEYLATVCPADLGWWGGFWHAWKVRRLARRACHRGATSR